MRNNKGFTLIELLVVIVIIGILATLATVALNSARGKARDARRVSDVRQIQTAIELYLNDQQSYPSPAGTGGCVAGTPAPGCMLSGAPLYYGTTTYMAKVPGNATPNEAGCESMPTTYVYTTSPASGNYTSYTITYCLGGQTGTIPSSYSTATPSGITGR